MKDKISLCCILMLFSLQLLSQNVIENDTIIYKTVKGFPINVGESHAIVGYVQRCLKLPVTENFDETTKNALIKAGYDLSNGLTWDLYGKIMSHCKREVEGNNSIKTIEPKDNNQKESFSKSSNTQATTCNCLDLSDNPSSYIGKTITVNFGYLKSYNSNVSLRMRDYKSNEQANTVVNLGLNDVDTDKYFVRVVDCNSGRNFFLLIPFSINENIPNLSTGYMVVTGVFKDRNTIIVSSINR